MKRLTIPVRPDWQLKVEDLGLLYHTVNGVPYWDESAAYEFTPREIETLENATNELQGIAIQTLEQIIARDWFHRMGITERARKLIIDSWEREPHQLSLYGRFDLAWDGTGEPKMLEYNADTPTSLLEAAVIQWHWFEELRPGADQFNSIHERLIQRWKDLMQTAIGAMHLCSMESIEDEGNVRYIGDTAAQAGIIIVAQLLMPEIGWDGSQFVDNTGRRIANMFKLYPWEWLLEDEFGDRLEAMRLIEPPWKMLLSNKALLPLMWELFPRHPNLLKASFAPFSGEYVSKPFWSREGSNVKIHAHSGLIQSGGNYGNQPLIYQEYYRLPDFAGNHPIIGSWIIGEEAAGIGIREDKSRITGDLSRFVPHYIA
jgi:glutathionylspermidine synthase